MSKQIGYMRRVGDVWELEVSTGVLRKNGNGYLRKTRRFKGTERQAKKELSRFAAEAMDGLHDQENISFKGFLEERLEAWKHDLKTTTYQGYKFIAEKHLYPELGRHKLKSLTPALIQRYYNNARERGRKDGKDKGLSGTTLQKHHQLIHKTLEDAVRWNYLLKNPAALVDKPKREKKEMAFLTIEEMNEFTESMNYSKWGELVYVAAWTGMRLGELLGLKWGDISLEHEFISVQRSLVFNAETKESKYETPKTDKSIRRIDLDFDLLAYMKSMKALHQDLFGEVNNDSPVFRNNDGSNFNNQSASQGIKKGLKKLGRGDCHFHSLRHSHASALLSCGTPLKVVSERLGHASIAITGDLYTHVAPSIQKHHIENLARLRTGQVTKKEPTGTLSYMTFSG